MSDAESGRDLPAHMGAVIPGVAEVSLVVRILGLLARVSGGKKLTQWFAARRDRRGTLLPFRCFVSIDRSGTSYVSVYCYLVNLRARTIRVHSSYVDVTVDSVSLRQIPGENFEVVESRGVAKLHFQRDLSDGEVRKFDKADYRLPPDHGSITGKAWLSPKHAVGFTNEPLPVAVSGLETRLVSAPRT